MIKPSPLLIRDKPTTELVELESQLYAEIMAIPATATGEGAVLGIALVQAIKAVRRQLRIRAVNQ